MVSGPLYFWDQFLEKVVNSKYIRTRPTLSGLKIKIFTKDQSSIFYIGCKVSFSTK